MRTVHLANNKEATPKVRTHREDFRVPFLLLDTVEPPCASVAAYTEHMLSLTLTLSLTTWSLRRAEPFVTSLNGMAWKAELWQASKVSLDEVSARWLLLFALHDSCHKLPIAENAANAGTETGSLPSDAPFQSTWNDWRYVL